MIQKGTSPETDWKRERNIERGPGRGTIRDMNRCIYRDKGRDRLEKGKEH